MFMKLIRYGYPLLDGHCCTGYTPCI